MNRNIARLLLALLVGFTFVAPVAFTQQRQEATTIRPAPPTRQNHLTAKQALDKHLAEAAAAGNPEEITPLTTPPRIDFAAWKGNHGSAPQEFVLGPAFLDHFTWVPGDENWVEILRFQELSYTSPSGHTVTLGRKGVWSSVRAKIEQAGWIVVEYTIWGVTVDTWPYEYYLSGGAIEGRYAMHSNGRGGWCRYEHWSTPERIDWSAKSAPNGRYQEGSTQPGKASLMFAEWCHWRTDTWAGPINHLIFNQQVDNPRRNVVTWQPFESYQNDPSQSGPPMRFDIGWLQFTLPYPL